MLLAELVQVSRAVGATQRRSEKIALLAEALRKMALDEIEVGVCFASGETRQSKLGVGPAAIMQARSALAAAAATLNLQEVDAVLVHIAGTSGAGSVARRSQLLSDLLARATAREQEFLVRLLFGELRQGALDGVMQEALARAASVPLATVRRAAMVAGGLASIARVALMEGEAGLGRFSLQLFQPVLPMLAQPAEDVEDALSQLGIARLEWKLDGARVQVHKLGDQVRVFSRGMNEVTAAVPEVVEVTRTLPSRALILDGETVALRPDGRPHPFQVTMRRFGRRLDVQQARDSLPLSVYVFDLLKRDDQDLIDLRADQRIAALAEIAPSGMLMPAVTTGDAATAQAFFDYAIRRGHEGIMAKSPDAPYEAGSRGVAWLKVKQAHTLDLVVLAAEWGHGRRRGWLSNLHLGARDERSGEFVMLGKTFKGLTDEMLIWQTQRLQELETARDRHTVYVLPELVVEIAVNEIQASPHYPAGLALRFARVKRYRTDKRAAEADLLTTVQALFERQSGKALG